ncbi:amino acid adenylation domain-containing protein [Paenibacillus sp. SYP-B3998]|uniref:Amino acid adenylation domain-containing protein n=1 Tax=Paenibacillus sp. SYP-B3998 TaxID=2678564 RepID=A0A6G4A4H1_9BACL|nr:non-ribosomal peptide synthetase [Paenibacillus sp. SYP-B3998]NEW09285.1 amino acid adenylation domain-containing protein [Paenibacillus sp. SYP-B3998]
MKGKAEIQDIYPLSYMQEGMLFQTLYDGEARAYVEQTTFKLQGRLDEDAFRESVQLLIDRYDIFRTIFLANVAEMTRPQQVVLKRREADVNFEDLRGLSENEMNIRVNAYSQDDRARGFDLSKDMLLRVAVLHTGQQRYTCIWSHHHILMDGWCIGIVMKEFFEAYRSRLSGQSVTLPRVRPYGEYIRWLTGRDLGEAQAYWSQQLDGCVGSLPLPWRRSRPEAGYHQKHAMLTLDEVVTSRLNALAQSSRLTVSTLLQTAWGALLQRYSGQDEAVFGAVVSGRPAQLDGIETMVGLFINTIPVRIGKREGGFLETARAVQENALAAEPHSYYPLYEIQARTEAKLNLIDHLFVFENYPLPTGADVTPDSSNALLVDDVAVCEQSHYDLNVTIVPGERLSIRFHYNANVYDETGMNSMLGHLSKVIDAVLNNPQINPNDIDLLSEGETEKLFSNSISHANPVLANYGEYGDQKTVPHLFEEHAAKTPNRIAIVCGKERLTYRQLNAQANRLARALRAKGTCHDDIVAIMAGRTSDMVIGVIAVWKAGGAYLPIDADYPAERIRFMLTDSGAKLLLTHRGEETPAEYANRTLIFDEEHTLSEENEFEDMESVEPTLEICPEHAAYMIYTSGTTGNPKGVIIEHGSYAGMTEAWRTTYELDQAELTLLQIASFSFDVFAADVARALSNGGRLIIAPKEARTDAYDLCQLIERESVTFFNATPAVIVPLVRYAAEHGRELRSLRVLITGGDVCHSSDFEQILRTVGHFAQVFNCYGVTEACVDALLYEANSQWSSVIDTTPIGRPFPHVRTYIVHPGLGRLQPIGVPGELCIGGIGVGRGYWNRPELNEERFVPDPFVPGGRMYRTGDLARWLPCGNMEFIGRFDQQLKIRGYRIEPGEIEARLLQTHGVREAVVTARLVDGQNELWAYVTGDDHVTAASLRETLALSLPAHMIPSRFVRLDKLPLTHNGKVDRSRLFAEGIEIESGSGGEYVAPRNSVEAKLARLWQDVLVASRPIGIRESFFEIGGHSLKATTLSSRIHQAFGCQMPLRDIFQYVTIEQMAKRIAAGNTRNTSNTAALRSTEIRPDYPASYSQKRLYLLNQMDTSQHNYNIPYIFEIVGVVDFTAFEAAFREIMRRHDSLRTSFGIRDGEPVQIVHTHADLPLVYETGSPKALDMEALVQSFVRPFDLNQAPLFRIGLIRLEEARHLFLFDIHHIVADGTSVHLLIDEFSRLYRGESLPELTVQYKDYAVWQRQLAEGEAYCVQEEYWLNRFTIAPPVLNLPTDYPRPAVMRYEGAHFPFTVSSEVTEKLYRLVSETKSTLYMVLLSALSVLLHRLSGQEDIVIGSPSAGRRHTELEPIIGMFINTLALRTFPHKDKSFLAFLEETKGTTLQSLEHQDYPFEELVDKLRVDRSLNRNPVFDVLLALQNMDQRSLDLGDLYMSAYPYVHPTAKFDLSLYVTEVEGLLRCSFEYSTELYTETTVRRLAAHLDTLLRSIADDPKRSLSDLPILTGEDIERLLFVGEPKLEGSAEVRTIHEQFEAKADRHPDKTAIVYRGETNTYGQLEARANQIAAYLCQYMKGKRETPIGVWMHASPHSIAAMLGILKAGGCYVPIDPDMPKDRVGDMLRDAGIPLLISTRTHMKSLNNLQWECTDLQGFLCLDCDDPNEVEEDEKNALMDERLWELVRSEGTGDILGGGWVSSYTGQPFTRLEMDEYADNILHKLKPRLHAGTRVLEIGCASGISMYRIAPHVGFYCGTDLSEAMIKQNQSVCEVEGWNHIQLHCLPADRIDELEEGAFDVVILNSVIQYFHGHNYLRRVLRQITSKLRDQGVLFIGDVMDLEQKEALFASLRQHQSDHPEDSTKTDFSSEWFVAKPFFEDLALDLPGMTVVSFSAKIATVENELTKFRYDVMLEVNKLEGVAPRNIGRRKFQHGARVLNACSETRIGLMPQLSDQLAYIIFTSGSTGKPKGVMIEHRSILNLNRSMCEIAGFSEHESVLCVTKICFDIHIVETLLPLMNGLRVIIADEDEQRDPKLLNRLLLRHPADVVQTTPSRMKLLLGDPQSLEGLRGARQVILGGEALSPALLEQLGHSTGADIYNMYGPTETAVYSTMQRLNGQNRISIGIPIAGTRVRIVDEELRLLPQGVVGELCIGGPGLARGYLGQPELTAARFVPDPYQPGERLYRTGDLARWLPDGTIDYLGRADHQVKLRGYRIELQEIEHQLLQVHGVKAAAVLLIGQSAEDGELSVYFTCDSPLASADIRTSLARKLPDYMIPSRYTQLDQMPLNANGKVDRRRLAATGDGSRAVRAYVPPQNWMEEQLVNIWKDVLGVDRVGITDRFFELGGNSLRVLETINRIHQQLHVEVTMRAMFEHPTVRQLAERVTLTGNGQSLMLLSPNKGSSGVTVICFPPIAGFSLLFKELADQLSLFGSFYGFDFIEEEDRIDRYVSELKTISGSDPLVFLGYSSGGNLAFETAQAAERQGIVIADIVMVDAWRKDQSGQQTLEEIEQQIKESITEYYALISDNEKLIDKAVRKRRIYQLYFNEMINTGQVQANIHMIHSETVIEDLEEKGIMLWQQATRGSYHSYQGAGQHFNMLSPEHLPKNVAVVSHILVNASDSVTLLSRA